MRKKPVTLEDIADAITTLQTRVAYNTTAIGQIDSRVSGLQSAVDDLTARSNDFNLYFLDLQANQRIANNRLGTIENKTLGIESDIKEIYDTMYSFQDDFGVFKDEYRSSQRRMRNFAKKVSVRTGVSFKP